MTNQNKLKMWIKSNLNGDYSTVSYSGSDLSTATVDQLKAMATDLGGDVDTILSTPSMPYTPPYKASTPSGTSAPSEAVRLAMQALEEAYKAEAEQKSASIDEDEVRILINETVTPMFDDIQKSIDAFEPLADTLKDIAKTMASGGSSRLPIATAVASGSYPILDLVAPYYKAGSKLSTKMCISAPPSFGKSHSINMLGKSYDKFLEWGCSGDMDEWSMLLGSCTPKSEGGFIVVDGKLTEAVRAASKGSNTLLFLDEVFRMGDATMEAMLAFLEPQADASGEKVYRLTTKQNDAGVLETITCSTEKLHIICATNLSSAIPPEAFLDRFLIKHMRFDVNLIAGIAENVATEYGIAHPAELGRAYAESLGASRHMHGSGQLLKPLSIRDLVKACSHAERPHAISVAKWIGDNTDSLCNWNSDTGDLIEDSVKGADALSKGLMDAVLKAVAKVGGINIE
jgi:hypothetical protein